MCADWDSDRRPTGPTPSPALALDDDIHSMPLTRYFLPSNSFLALMVRGSFSSVSSVVRRSEDSGDLTARYDEVLSWRQLAPGLIRRCRSSSAHFKTNSSTPLANPSSSIPPVT